jgi:hypothetical protein
MPLSLSRREEGSRKNIYHVNRPSGAKPTIFVGSVGFAERRWFTKKLNLMALIVGANAIKYLPFSLN